MPSKESMPNRAVWKPGMPRTWEIEAERVELDGSVERLVILSDLHSHREPLEAVDSYLRGLGGRYEVFVAGDIFEGGMDAAATVEWVQRRATGRTVRGNHDNGVFRYMAASEHERATDTSPPDSERAGYGQLSADQISFIAGLPDELMVRWRGRTIRILHGHQNHNNPDYTSWKSTPDQLMSLFHDPAFDLTVIGHTHFPFVRETEGSLLANCGSSAVPICRIRTADGAIEDRCAAETPIPKDCCNPSLLTVTESGGQLKAEIVHFDYDRRALLSRYANATNMTMPYHFREVWVTEGFFDLAAMG